MVSPLLRSPHACGQRSEWLEAQVLAAPGPDHQSAGIPVGPVTLPPAVVQGWRTIGALQLRQQIVLLAAGKRFNPPLKQSI